MHVRKRIQLLQEVVQVTLGHLGLGRLEPLFDHHPMKQWFATSLGLQSPLNGGSLKWPLLLSLGGNFKRTFGEWYLMFAILECLILDQ